MTYIFDFDGTLVDSMPTFGDAMVDIFKKENLPLPDDFVKIITPLGYKGTAEYAIKCGYTKDADTFVSDAAAAMVPAYLYDIPLKDPCLKRVGVYDLFDRIWSCEDFSLTKADTLLYEKVAAALNEKIADCIFLDDNIGSVSTGKKAGMTTIAVYDQSSEDMVEEMKKVSDRYIYSFAEL